MGETYNHISNIGAAAWSAGVAAAGWFTGKLNGAFLSALFGALGGSYSAYLLGVRNERRKSLKDEMAATNNAIGLTLIFINQMLTFKGQGVLPVVEHYERQFKAYMATCVAPHPPGPPITYTLSGDSRRLEMPHTPLDALTKVVGEKVNRSTMANMLVASLQHSAALLRGVLEMRNGALAGMGNQRPDIVALLYFGAKDPEGNLNELFPDAMTGIGVYLDDCLYHADLLAEKLTEHGNALRKAYGRRAPKTATVDLSDPRIAPLLPDRSKYADFERQYRQPKGSTGWWATLKERLSR